HHHIILDNVFFKDSNDTDIYSLSLHDALPILSSNEPITVTGYPGVKPLATMWESSGKVKSNNDNILTYSASTFGGNSGSPVNMRSEEHTSELQSRFDLVCRLLLEKKKKMKKKI